MKKLLAVSAAAAAVVASIAACNQGYKGPKIPAALGPSIDAHLHTGEWKSIPPTTQTFIANAFPAALKPFVGSLVDSTLSSDGIIGQLDEAGLSAGVLFAVYAPKTVGVATNELVRDRVERDRTRLLGMASVSVEDWGAKKTSRLLELETALVAYRLIGIKLAHPHVHVALDDRSYYGIYEVAERTGAPVFLHTGTSPQPGTSQDPHATDPGFLEDAIRTFPKVTFILGHVGYDFGKKDLGKLATCIDLARRYPNVVLEASALGSDASDPTKQNLPKVLRAIRAAGLAGRLIHGSDGPQRPGFVGTYANRILETRQAEGYTTAEQKQVLGGTFLEVFKTSLRRVYGPVLPATLR